jgi:hypothetical protein
LRDKTLNKVNELLDFINAHSKKDYHIFVSPQIGVKHLKYELWAGASYSTPEMSDKHILHTFYALGNFLRELRAIKAYIEAEGSI